MKRCKTHLMRVCVFLLASVPAYCQRGTFGIDVGQTSDKFDSLSAVSGLVAGIDGQVRILKETEKRPSIVVGGEIWLPSDSGNHAREYAVFGGPRFHARDFLIGFNVQLEKIVLPNANVDNQFFARDSMRLLETPLVLRYNFGPGKRLFIEAQGAPEFTPHFHQSSSSVILPNPRLDHGYFVRGTLGYTLGKWYVKAAYETRYFKFVPDQGNPTNLYNWKTNRITGGVGFSF